MYTGLHVKYPLCLSDFNKTWFFSTEFRKIFEYQISWKSVQWDPICSTRTETTKRIVVFRNFAKAPKSGKPHISQLFSGKRHSSLLQWVQTGAGANQPPTKRLPGPAYECVNLHLHSQYISLLCYVIRHRDIFMCFCIFLEDLLLKKVTIVWLHFHLPRLWMCGAIPPLPIYLYSVLLNEAQR